MKNLIATLFVLSTLLYFGCSSSQNVAGNVDETNTGIRISAIYNPNGKPAVGATVKVFESEGTTVVFETTTGVNGEYTLRGLKGSYTIIAESDSLVAFQDSVYISADTQYIESDTLETPRNVTAQVALQNGDDVRTVTVDILGTYFNANVNEDGWFTIPNMPTGTYTIRLMTTLENYNTTYKTIVISETTPDTLASPLEMIYTGGPIVTGITGKWIQYITQTGFSQENIYDFQTSGKLETIENVTKYTENNITYEGDVLVIYMDSIGRTNPNFTTDYWKVSGNELIISKNLDFSDADTATYAINRNQLTITYRDYSFISIRMD